MAQAGYLLGMGNPLLDISAHVGKDVLEKYGVTLNNAILAEEKHLPLYEELVAKDDVEYIAGGATQNSIRGAQFMSGIEGLTTMIGCVGSDGYSEQLKAAAKKDGVRVEYLEDEAATGTCAVLVHEHERSLVANLSAANNYKIDHLKSDKIQEIVKAAKLYYIAGFFLTVSVDSVELVGKHVVENPGKRLIMNLAAPFICQFFGEQLKKALYYCDIVIGNESEAEAYAQANGIEDTSAASVAKAIAELPKASEGKRIVIITQGAEPVVVSEEGEIRSYNVPTIPEEDMVDFNGAGDAFAGGFLARLALGESVKDGVAAGLWSARQVIKASGCKYPDECTYDHAAQLKALGL